jgi:hypothetical protein
VSEEIGSGGIACGSRTGSGGAGGRAPFAELPAGGGVVGRATGGFFFAQPPAIDSAITRITNA